MRRYREEAEAEAEAASIHSLTHSCMARRFVCDSWHFWGGCLFWAIGPYIALGNEEGGGKRFGKREME